MRTIKAQYNNTSFANLIRGDSFGASAVIMEKVKVKEATAKGYAEIGVGGCCRWLSLNQRQGEAE